MPKKIKVSVIIPAFNTEKYIAETIESVLNQKFDDSEIIIIDDSSTDKTFSIINQYSHNPKVSIFQNKKNLGETATRNLLIAKAKGEYITPCDSDDIMLPNNLNRLSTILDRFPKIGAVYGDILAIEMNKSLQPSVSGKDFKNSWDIFENAPNHAGSMFRKDLLQKIGGYDERFRTQMTDWELWIKLSEITQFKYLAGEFYYLWRRHSSSITRNKKIMKKTKENYQAMLLRTLKRRYGEHYSFGF